MTGREEMPDVEFVVARFEEPIEWIEALAPHRVTVYAKSPTHQGGGHIPLPNVGREAHTFAHHIVSRYASLAEVTVFLQGRPWDHTCTADRNVPLGPGTLARTIKTYAFDRTEPFFVTPRHHDEMGNGAYAELFGRRPPPVVLFSAGGQWIVQKADILCRPLSFYQNLLSLLSVPRACQEDGVVNAWTVERLWQYIFDPAGPGLKS